MNKQLQYAALAAFIGAASSGVAHADSASTTGGFKIKSDDGNFEASIGGRVHFDYAYLDPDTAAYGSTDTKHYGTDALDNTSGFYFRRVFLTLQGKAYGWDYKVEDDLTGGERGAEPATTTTTNACTTTTSGSKTTTTCTATSATTTFPAGAGFQDLYIAKSFHGGDGTVTFGQRKPYRSFEEQQSNNDILFMERNVTSATGIFGGRDFQDGLFFKYQYKPQSIWAGASVYSMSKVGQGSTEGMGYNARVVWAPINSKGKLLHVGYSFSSDHADNGKSIAPAYRFAGYGLSNNQSLTLASYAGTAGVGGHYNADANTWTGELVGILGPAYFEGEYAHESLGAQSATVGSDVDAYAIQGSVFLTGESKTYNAAGATVGTPKPLHSYGALELKLRYEDIKNDSVADLTSTTSNAGIVKCAVSNKPAGLIDKCETSDIAGGINYYVNPNVRFMFDYVAATTDLGTAGKDKPNTIAARVQMSF